MSLDRRSRFKVDRNDFVESSYFADDNNTQDNVEQDRITSVTNTLFRELSHIKVAPHNSNATAGEGVDYHDSIINQLSALLNEINLKDLAHMSSATLTAASTGGVLLWQSPTVEAICHALDALQGMALLAHSPANISASIALASFVEQICKYSSENPNEMTSFCGEASSEIDSSDDDDNDENIEPQRGKFIPHNISKSKSIKSNLEDMKLEAATKIFGIHMPVCHQLLSAALRTCVPIMNLAGTNSSSASMTADVKKVREILCEKIVKIFSEYPNTGRWSADESQLRINEEKCVERRRLLARIASMSKKSQAAANDDEDDEDDDDAKSPKKAKNEGSKDKKLDENEDEKPLIVLKQEEIRMEVSRASDIWFSFIQAVAATSLEKADWRIAAANSLVRLLAASPKDTAEKAILFFITLMNSDKAIHRVVSIELLHEMFSNEKVKNIFNVKAAVLKSLSTKSAYILNAQKTSYDTTQDKKDKISGRTPRTVKGNRTRVLADSSSESEDEEDDDDDDDDNEGEEKKLDKHGSCKTPKKEMKTKLKRENNGSESGDSSSESQSEGEKEDEDFSVNTPQPSTSRNSPPSSQNLDIEGEDAHEEHSSQTTLNIISNRITMAFLKSLCMRTHDSVATVRTRAVQAYCHMLKWLIDSPELLLISLDYNSDSSDQSSSSINISSNADPIKISVRDLYASLALDERVINRRAALSLFDEITSLISRSLQKQIDETLRFLFPIRTIRSLIEDSALLVRKQAMHSLTNLLVLNPSDELVRRLWLSLALPCLLDPEASVADATLDIIKSHVFYPIAALSSSSSGIRRTPGIQLALGLLKSADEDAAELMQRALRMCISKASLVSQEFSKGLKTTIAFDQLNCTSSGAQGKTDDVFVVSQWNLGLWALLEEASGLRNCSFPIDFLVSSWQSVEKAVIAVDANPLHLILPDGSTPNHENSDLLRSAIRTTRRSLVMRTPAGGSFVMSPIEEAIEDFRIKSDRSHKLSIVARRVLSALVNLMEKNAISTDIRDKLRSNTELHITAVDMPSAVLGKIVSLLTALASTEKNSSVSNSATVNAKVATMQAEADKNKRIGDACRNIDKAAIHFLQTQIDELHTRLGQFVLKLVEAKKAIIDAAMERENNAECDQNIKNKNNYALPTLTPARNATASLAALSTTFLIPSLVEKTCKDTELIGLLSVACPTSNINEQLALILQTIAADVQLPSRLRSHAIWALGRLLITVSAKPLVANSLNSESSKSTKILNKSSISAMADTIAIWTRSNHPTTVRNAALIVLCDLCRLASGTGVEQHIDRLSDTLADLSPLLRKQSLWLLAQLASEDFVKLNARTTDAGPLVFRLLVSVSDDVEIIRHFGEVFFQRVAMAKCEKLVVKETLDIIYFLNGVKDSTITKNTGSSGEGFELRSRDKRNKIYKFLVSQLKEIEKKELISRLVNNFLALFIDSKDEHSRDALLQLPKSIETPMGAALKDALTILSSKELRIGAKLNSYVKTSSAAAAAGEDPTAANGGLAKDVESDSMAGLMKAVKDLLAQDILPVLLSLKKMMETRTCPLLGDVRNCIVDMLADFKSSVHELLAGDRYFAKEVEQILNQRMKLEVQKAALADND